MTANPATVEMAPAHIPRGAVSFTGRFAALARDWVSQSPPTTLESDTAVITAVATTFGPSMISSTAPW